ncbi:MAG: carbon-nitrogen hydrolase family protein [Verrucomicrobia bacterium]|nr:carbon-nitrogen hydrolase family protein [Verrucomicrobiota bacterium]
MIQMRIEPGALAENLEHAVALVAEAASHGATVAVLPEALPLGWTDPSARTHADAIPDGNACVTLRAAAERHRIWICGGLIERVEGRIFNAAVLIDPVGAVRVHHRKLNELEIAQDLYALGDRLQVARTPLGTFGVMICADAFARGQVISRTLGRMGADVILSPSSWAVPAHHDHRAQPYGQLWLDNYQPVARDFQMWIIGVSNVGWIRRGPWTGRKCIGCSLAVNPDGEAVVTGPYGHDAECLLYVDIRPRSRPARGDGWERWWRSGTGA